MHQTSSLQGWFFKNINKSDFPKGIAALRNESLYLLPEFPFEHPTWKGSVSTALTPLPAHVWVFILTFPEVLYLFMITARSVCTETIVLLPEGLNHNLSFSLLLFLKPSFYFSSDSLQEEESWPPADWLRLGGVGCVAGGRERGRAVKCYRNSWLKRGNGRYITSSIDTDRVGARLNCNAAHWITSTM